MDLKTLQAALGRTIEADALLLPLTDPTLAEYAAPEWRFAPLLTGFTGSSGDVFVVRNRAALLTDSRYWVQAEHELFDGVELLRDDPRSTKISWAEWLRAVLPEGGTLGVDARMVSEKRLELLRTELSPLGIEVRFVAMPALPGLPSTDPCIRRMHEPARTVAERVEAVLSLADDPNAVFVTMSPDAVAWTLNLRNIARPASPVFPSALALAGGQVLFATEVPLNAEVLASLRREEVAVVEGLRNLPEALSPFSERVLVFDAATTSAALAGSLRAFWRGGVRSTSSVFELAMSRKSASEIKCIEEAMRRDGVALTEFYAELDERLAAGEMLSECAAASLLHEHRSKQDGFLGESFETIAAFGANAAMPHYVPKAGSDAMLAGDGLLLIDSGGQYWCGTTDVTRMTPIGRLSQEDRREAGLVTRAMLKLARQRFPEGARGASVDAAARTVLWDEGVDYGHGTGHGVGFVLNVHEGPVRLSPGCLEPLAAGNVLSDEPGLYREGVRGIRVENMLVAVPDAHACGMLRWKALTCVPIDVRTLPEEGIGLETADLNAYNAWVCQRLSPYLSERALRWLEKAARPIPII